MKKHKLAACAIDCNECGHYKLSMAHDVKSAECLVEYFRDGGWIGENDGADAVLKKVPVCRGCWDKTAVRTHDCTNCLLRACCEEKQFNFCGECGDFPCDKYISFVGDNEHHKKTMEYLLSLRRKK